MRPKTWMEEENEENRPLQLRDPPRRDEESRSRNEQGRVEGFSYHPRPINQYIPENRARYNASVPEFMIRNPDPFGGDRGRGGRGRGLERRRGDGRRIGGWRGAGRERERGTGSEKKDAIMVEPCECPRDINGNLIPFRMNIEMNVKEQERENHRRTEQIMHFYRSVLMAETRLFGITIVNEDHMQIISEGRQCILTFQARCENAPSSFTSFARSFNTTVLKSEMEVSELPYISTHSLSLYPLRLVNTHNIPLAAIHFGSMINNGLLGIHWSMTGGSQTAVDVLNDCYSFHKGIYAFFEYDKRRISIKYFNREADSINRDLEYDIEGKVSLEMSSIERIFFDQRNEDESIQVSLVFLVKFPPKLQVHRRGDNAWEYRNKLQRGDFPRETSHKEALHDSKAVILHFDTNKIKQSLVGNSTFDAFLHEILSRLTQRTGKRIDYSPFCRVKKIEGEVRRRWTDYGGEEKLTRAESVCPYYYNSENYDGDRIEFDYTVRRKIDDASGHLIDQNEETDRACWDYHVRWKAFRLHALIQGILDRGMEYRIELLSDRKIWTSFVESISTLYENDEEGTLNALERVMHSISEGRPNCSILALFKKEKERNENNTSLRSALINEQDRKDGYWKIMKFEVTPTRVKFVGYEVIMGNRVLNKYATNENHMIRVEFADDCGGSIQASNCALEIKDRIKNILLKGLTYAGRTYVWLGNSNSQLRDHHGCYMLHIDFSGLMPQEIRSRMGEFHLLPNIPKMMARLGLVFTQSKPSEMVLSASGVGVTADLVGGRNSAGKPYIFSDGVGRISIAHAQAISAEQGLHTTASAFQIRFKGAKGMLCTDPSIDQRNDLLKMMGKENEEKKMFVRPSMIKFQVIEQGGLKLEIVKSSNSAITYLNRPLINILCQVSKKQSDECHERVKGRVKELLQLKLKESIQSLYVERKALEAIRELSFPFSMEVLTVTTGLLLTKEPFFRSLLLANMKYIIQKKLQKMKIPIPSSSARLMFGVVDESGLLQSGQVYCQYTGSTSKTGSSGHSVGNRRGIILKGPIMLTKNPCYSTGDVRMFEAVDIPALSHLVDVVVFPRYGPRPHTDEMAGSDLDGDEYLVIWDEKLFLERNEEASIFPIEEEKENWAIPKSEDGEVDWKRCEERKAEFFTENIVHGNPGVYCNAHLAVSDLYGLDSKPAKTLEMKIAQALDYQKSGVQPKKMTMKDVEDPDDRSRVIPAEKSKWKPDFLQNYRDAGYQSRGILGEVFREMSKYECAFDSGEGMIEKVEVDPSFLVTEWAKYKSSVEKELAEYSYAMQSVCQHFGITSEEEMLSGRGDKNEERGKPGRSMTNRIIEGRVRRLQEAAREKFFDALIDWRVELEVVEDKRNDVKPDSILNMRVRSYTQNIEEIRRKASAAYSVAYEAANERVEKGEQCAILLSFPWLFYDVLLNIKRVPDAIEEFGDEEKEREESNEPIAIDLSEFIDQYTENPSNKGKFADFKSKFESNYSIVGRSIMENEGLAKTAFVLVEWANHVGGLSRRFGEEHLVSLFILFGLGEVDNRGMKRKFIQKPCGDMRVHSKKGEHLLAFIEYVSSREFKVRPSLSLFAVGGGILMRGEWKDLSEASLASFLSLVINNRLELPMNGESGMGNVLKEYEPRVMQLPQSVYNEEMEKVKDALTTVSGCKAIKLRKQTPPLVMVSALGTNQQLRVLSSFIYPPAPSRDTATLKGKIDALATVTYNRIMKSANSLPPRH